MEKWGSDYIVPGEFHAYDAQEYVDRVRTYLQNSDANLNALSHRKAVREDFDRNLGIRLSEEFKTVEALYGDASEELKQAFFEGYGYKLKLFALATVAAKEDGVIHSDLSELGDNLANEV